MKIKKRQFARLKDIAEEVNTCGVFGLTGLKLGKLIADIESVQKVKNIQETPVWRHFSGRSSGPIENIVFDKYRKDVENNIQKEGDAMVAASTDEGTEFKGGLRDSVRAIKELEDRHQKKLETIRRDADEALFNIKKNVYDTDPKIGDVGYFWTTGNDIHYGKLKEISSSEFKGKSYKVYRISESDGCKFYTNFSKTPPELK